jgi:hypothetical protein
MYRSVFCVAPRFQVKETASIPKGTCVWPNSITAFRNLCSPYNSVYLLDADWQTNTTNSNRGISFLLEDAPIMFEIFNSSFRLGPRGLSKNAICLLAGHTFHSIKRDRYAELYKHPLARANSICTRCGHILADSSENSCPQYLSQSAHSNS